jgi:hypothetical protein
MLQPIPGKSIPHLTAYRQAAPITSNSRLMVAGAVILSVCTAPLIGWTRRIAT